MNGIGYRLGCANSKDGQHWHRFFDKEILPLDPSGFDWKNSSLYASSDAVDTDFIAQLVDLYPRRPLTAFSVRDPSCTLPRQSKPSKAASAWSGLPFDNRSARYQQRFLPGHRIHLDISSSEFPQVPPKLQYRGAIWLEQENCGGAPICLPHREIPSHMTLPVIEGGNSRH